MEQLLGNNRYKKLTDSDNFLIWVTSGPYFYLKHSPHNNIYEWYRTENRTQNIQIIMS